MRPPPKLTVSEWADRYRKLSPEASAEPGQWATSRYEYQRGIMDAFTDATLDGVAVMTSAQVGKTEILNNVIGYHVDQDPAPILLVLQTLEIAEAHSKDRLAPMVRDTPNLQGKIADPKARDSGNTIRHKKFPGGSLTLCGANSPASLASRPIRIVLCDEVDRYEITKEGDAVDLALRRAARFWNRRIGLFSTPTREGKSRIARAYEQGDQRKFFVRCPDCQQEQVLVWAQVQWDNDDPGTARYVCSECSAWWDDGARWRAVSKGQWRALNPGSRWASFHVWEAYAPGTRLSDIVRRFLIAKDHRSSLEVFVNTVLGETWKEATGESPDWKRLYERREDYAPGTVPHGGLFLTAGIDVQKNRIECHVRAWGERKENWLVDYAVHDGLTADTPVWAKLSEWINTRYQHASGIDVALSKIAIDSGYETQRVYQWARNYPGMVMAVDGRDTGVSAIGRPRDVDITERGRTVRRNGAKIWPINVSMLKAELYGWLNLDAPTYEQLSEGAQYPSGYCHFYQEDQEFFEQLVSERLVVSHDNEKHLTTYKWEKVRDRNEVLDTFNYAHAAAIAYGLDRFKSEQWAALRAQFPDDAGHMVSIAEPVRAEPAMQPQVAPVAAQSRGNGWFSGSRGGWFSR